VEHLTDLYPAAKEFFARRIDIGNDEIKSLGRARGGCG
jgi:hypothetical protein